MASAARATAQQGLDKPRRGPVALARFAEATPPCTTAICAAVYLALGFFIWVHAWLAPIGHALPTGYGDPAQELWFLEWGAYALGHGLNPFFSGSIDVPHVVDVAANPSTLLPAIVLAPLTLAFGPVVSEVVLVTLAPVLSALASMCLCRRYTSRVGPAFVGGLLYGFSPALLAELRFAHVNLALLPLPPLIALVLDEIFIRRTRRPARLGGLLGLLAAAQFFISPEVLAMMLVVVACAALVALARTDRHGIPAGAARHVAACLGIAALVASLLLAYPLWAFVAGPGHYSGPPTRPVANFSATLLGIVLPWQHTFSVGYVSGGNTAYLGAPLVLLLIGCRWRLRRDRQFSFVFDMAAICWVLSLGYRLYVTPGTATVVLPGALLQYIPLAKDILSYRFAIFTSLFAALGLAIALDRILAVGIAPTALAARPAGATAADEAARTGCFPRWRQGPIALGVAALMLLPPWLAVRLPYSATHVTVPAVLGTPAFAGLPVGSIVATYPTPTPYSTAPMAWQAIGGLRYRLVGGDALIGLTDGRAGEAPPDGLSFVFVANALGRLPLRPSRSTAALLRDEARILDVAAIVIVGSAPRAGRLEEFLRDVFGPPIAAAGGWLWRLSPDDGRKTGRIFPVLIVTGATKVRVCPTSVVGARTITELLHWELLPTCDKS